MNIVQKTVKTVMPQKISVTGVIIMRLHIIMLALSQNFNFFNYFLYKINCFVYSSGSILS